MIMNLEQELDRALARNVDLEDQCEEKDDAIRVLLERLQSSEAELASVRLRNEQLEGLELSRHRAPVVTRPEKTLLPEQRGREEDSEAYRGSQADDG